MKATTVFLARVNDGTGKFPFVPVPMEKGRPKPPKGATAFYARYSGTRPNGSHGRVVKALGSDLDAAYVAFLNIDTANQKQRAGVAPPSDIQVEALKGQTSLADAIETYLKDSQTVGNANNTIESKTRTLHTFLAIAARNGVSTVEQLRDPKNGRRVILAYLSWMQENLAKQGITGVRPENTYHSRMRRLGAFLKQHDIKIKKDRNASPADPGLLRHEEFPKYKARAKKTYSQATIKALLAAADVDQADLIHFVLNTGFRDEEIQFAEWSDVNFQDRLINVYSKPRTATRNWEWKPKDDESREESIPLSAEFVARMKARRARMANQKCALIFPSGVCYPDCNLLRRLRAVAKAAGIEQHMNLHTFRKTFGSIIAKAYGMERARKYLGHSKIETTQLYVSDIEDGESTPIDQVFSFAK
jgi:integrase